MIETSKFEKIQVSSQDELRSWLLGHHTQKESVWLVTFKKNVEDKYVSTGQVLDELLCFGWIDGIRKKLDHDRTMQLISPRKAQHWSATYKSRAQRLIAQNRMHESGLNAIQRSKELGLWNFLDDVDKLIIPEDLKTALTAKPGAFEFFDQINDSSKRFTLRWLKLARTDMTRQNRIARIVELSVAGQKLPGS